MRGAAKKLKNLQEIIKISGWVLKSWVICDDEPDEARWAQVDQFWSEERWERRHKINQGSLSFIIQDIHKYFLTFLCKIAFMINSLKAQLTINWKLTRVSSLYMGRIIFISSAISDWSPFQHLLPRVSKWPDQGNRGLGRRLRCHWTLGLSQKKIVNQWMMKVSIHIVSFPCFTHLVFSEHSPEEGL